jgi:hypothetical protein
MLLMTSAVALSMAPATMAGERVGVVTNIAKLSAGVELGGHPDQNLPAWRVVTADAFVTGGRTR